MVTHAPPGGGSSASASEQDGASLWANAQSAQNNQLFSLGTKYPNQPLVFLGMGQARPGDDVMTAGKSMLVPKWATPTDAAEMWYDLSSKQQDDIIAKGIIGGQLQSDAGKLEGAELWGKLVADAARYGARGQQYGPLDILNSYVSAAGHGPTDEQKFKASGGGGFPEGARFDKNGKYTGSYRSGDFIVDAITGKRQYVGPKFKTQSEVDLTDPATAHALVTSIFQQLLGRDPGQGELGSFAQTLQQAEQANPVTITSSDQYDDYGNVVNSSSTRTGGLDQAGKEYLLEQEAKKNPEYGATQAATTYFGALEKAIWGGPGA